jgi:integrase
VKGHISTSKIERLEAGQVLWDDIDCGFGVRRQRHTPVYLLKYRSDGRQHYVTIGRHGSPWTCEGARTEARRLLGLIQKRETATEPLKFRRSKTAVPYFAEVADRYLTEFAKPRKKPSSVGADRRNLELHVLPHIGDLKISEITRPLLIKMHSAQHAHPVSANRCLAVTSHIFSMAEKWGLAEIGSNPCRGIDRFPETPRERFLTESELGKLGAALEVATEGYHIVDWTTYPRKDKPLRLTPEDWRSIAATRLLLLTGARMTEILSLRWIWIDWSLGIARLPDSKTGAKTLFLPRPVIKLLREIESRVGKESPESPYVLPGNRSGTHFQGLQHAWQRIRTVARLKDVRIHDLRHAYASTAVARGDSLYIVGRILGHRRTETTQRYAHLAVDPVLEVADRTATLIASFLEAGRKI